MADLRSPLVPEEHEYLNQMVKSPGWMVLMEKVIIPELVQVSRHIDNVNESERDTQLYRGAKLTLARLIATVYRGARLQNPLEEHYQGLLTSVRGYTEDYIEQDTPAKELPLLPRRRTARPV